MIVWLIDNCIHALLKIPIHWTLKTANYHSVLEMLSSWTCLHYNDNNCPEGLQNKYKIIEFDLTPWNLSFSQYVIFWQGVWLLISLQVSLGSFKLWFEIPRYFNSFYYYMHKSRCYCKWFMNLSYSWPVIRNIFKHMQKSYWRLLFPKYFQRCYNDWLNLQKML